MRLSRLALLLLLAALIAPATVSTEPSTRDTRMLAQPAINGTHVAFVYADDLWVADLDGTDVRRLTTDDGVESRPAFSPDGTLIAFTAQYDGNADVYVVPAEGGVPTRLTWHPGPDVVQGFAATASASCSRRGRAVFTGAYSSSSPCRSRAASKSSCRSRTPPRRRTRPTAGASPTTRCRRRSTSGSTTAAARVSRLWLYGTRGPRRSRRCRSRPTAPTTSTRCGSATRSTSGRTATASSTSSPTTPRRSRSGRSRSTTTFPVLKASAGGGKIVYEQAGWLHLLDPASGRRSGSTIGVAADLRETRAAVRQGRPSAIRDVGALAVGRAGRLRVPRRDRHRAGREGRRAQPDRHARRPRAVAGLVAGRHARSPTSRTRRASTSCTSRRRTARATRRGTSSPAPASTRTCAGRPTARRSRSSTTRSRRSGSTWRPGTMKRVGGNRIYGADQAASACDWSPDSKWLAYVVNTQPLVKTVFALLARAGQVVPDHRRPERRDRARRSTRAASTSTSSPRPTRARCRTGSRSRTPTCARTRNVYLAVLRKGIVSPLAKESDEEKPKKADAPAEKAGDKPAAAPRSPPRRRQARRRGQEARGREEGAGRDRLRRPRAPHPRAAGSRRRALRTCRRATRGRSTTSAATAADASLQPLRPDEAQERDAARRRSTTTRSRPTGRRCCTPTDRAWSIVTATGPKIEPGEGRIAAADIEVRIDPRGRVGADLRRGLAHQPRLLLRPEHARRRLAGDEGEVRRVPAAPRHARRPEPRHPVDVQRAGGRPHRDGRRRPARASRGPCPAACSAPTTRSRTAATASRRSTAA